MDKHWVRFDATCDFDGRQTGPAVVDASCVISVEARTMGKTSIVDTFFTTKIKENETRCVEICFVGGSSICVLWGLANVLKALGITEAVNE